MDKKESAQLNTLVTTVVVLSLFCLCMYGLFGIYGFSLFPDEFGYWASAARNVGYDWSKVASIGSYYSFGYSLILTPILYLIKDSIIAYRTAIVINLIFQLLSFFTIKNILGIYFHRDKKDLLINIISGVAVLYPSWIFYTQMTMSEGVIFFLYHVVILLAMRFMEKGSLGNGLVLAVSSVYLYSVHMRTIGVLASTALMFLYLIMSDKKRRTASAISLGILIAGYAVCLFIKEDVASALYSSGFVSTVSVNDYSGQVGKLASLFSLNGIGKLLASMAGKLLYLGCASFGTAYIGIFTLIKKAVNKSEKALFILMTTFMQFMVMNIYLIESANVNANRFDLFLHGRYFDFAIPLLMAIGIIELITEEEHIKKMFYSNLVMLAAAVISIIVCVCNKTGMSDPHGMLMIGMSFFLSEDDVRPVSVIVCSLILTLFICVVLMFLVTAFKEKGNYYALLAFFVIQIALGYHALNHFVYIGQTYIYGDVLVADKISDLRITGNDSAVFLLYEDGKEYIDNIQFRLPEEDIQVIYMSAIDGDEGAFIADLPESSIVLVDFESGLNDLIRDKYDKSWESGHFIMYYNAENEMM